MSRYAKPVGWRGESYRHYLAAKGVRTRRTSRYMAFMTSPTDYRETLTGLPEHHQGTPGTHAHIFRKWNEEIVMMSPQEFLDITRRASSIDEGRFVGKEEFERYARSPMVAERRAEIAKGLKSAEGMVPIVFYEVDAQGNLLGTQEGRTRAIVAEELGMEKIPVAKYTLRTEAQKRREEEGFGEAHGWVR